MIENSKTGLIRVEDNYTKQERLVSIFYVNDFIHLDGTWYDVEDLLELIRKFRDD
jgi:hypothetical protein